MVLWGKSGVNPRGAQAMSGREPTSRDRDDCVLPFAVEALDVRGRLARLGPALDAIFRRHAYPPPIARAVGEAAVLGVLLGSTLRTDGRFQLQTKTDGPLNMIVVDFDAPDRLRAFARYAADALPEAVSTGELLGSGHLALTIEDLRADSRYQGVVPVSGQGLEQAAHEYFTQSEQIPTFVRLAVAQEITARGEHWRGGGLLLQFLPSSPGRLRQADLAPGDAPPGAVLHYTVEDDAWTEAKALAATVEDHELIDPGLPSQHLLYRLFHERGASIFEPHSVRDQCRCSTARIEQMLRSFSTKERADMIDARGRIAVTCEFCSTKRDFEPGAFEP